jgi:hypothetical protein
MKQAFHIFAKDVRLYWIEILANLTLTALFVWFYPMSWRESQTILVWPWVPSTTVGLMLVSWLVLITRVIHAENLVGERQFWITRPYRWPQLIAAKVLFVAAFLYVPFFLALCLLLRQAGMHPYSYMAGLFYELLLTTGIAVLPMACLAAVTSNFAKTLLALLGVILFTGGVAYLSSILPTSSTTDSFSDVLSFVVAVSVFVAVLLIQYSRRSTGIAWALIVALAVTFAVFGLAVPEDFAIKDLYPVSTSTRGPRIAFSQALTSASVTRSDLRNSREITVVFPITISGIAPNTALRISAARVSLTGLDGTRWTSHWQDVFVTLLPGESTGAVSLKISRSYFDRMKDKPVTVEMSAALTLLKAGNATRLTLPTKRFELPGGGLCHASGGWENSLSCLFPMRQPALMLIGTRLSTEDCSAAPPSNNGDLGLAWVGTLDTQPADFGLTSVWETSVWFQRFSSGGSTQLEYLCPGSPLSVVLYTVATRSQQKFVSQPVTLKNFVPSGF